MSDDKEKYFEFLNQIPKVPSLKTWDPVFFAPKLRIDGIITTDEMERLGKLNGKDERKIVIIQNIVMFKNVFTFEHLVSLSGSPALKVT